MDGMNLKGGFKTQSASTNWAHQGAGFNDVTLGRNSKKKAGTFVCPKSYAYICEAGMGYDGPTGWGYAQRRGQPLDLRDESSSSRARRLLRIIASTAFFARTAA